MPSSHFFHLFEDPDFHSSAGSWKKGEISFGVVDTGGQPICLISPDNLSHEEMLEQLLFGVVRSKRFKFKPTVCRIFAYPNRTVTAQTELRRRWRAYEGDGALRTLFSPCGRVWLNPKVVAFWEPAAQVRPYLPLISQALQKWAGVNILDETFLFDYAAPDADLTTIMSKAHTDPENLTAKEKQVRDQFRGPAHPADHPDAKMAQAGGFDSIAAFRDQWRLGD